MKDCSNLIYITITSSLGHCVSIFTRTLFTIGHRIGSCSTSNLSSLHNVYHNTVVLTLVSVIFPPFILLTNYSRNTRVSLFFLSGGIIALLYSEFGIRFEMLVILILLPLGFNKPFPRVYSGTVLSLLRRRVYTPF